MRAVLPLEEREREFLDRRNDAGNIVPALLPMLVRLCSHAHVRERGVLVTAAGTSACRPRRPTR